MITIRKLIRSRRKTVALVIEADGSLTVRAPQRLSLERIHALVEANAGRIAERRLRLQALPQPESHRYLPGERFFYLGAAYPLEVVERQAERLHWDETVFRLRRAEQAHGEAVFTDWYRRAARCEFTQRVERLQTLYSYTHAGLRISSARTRWGSCGPHGSLNFTWRLVMAPSAVIDYVIVHELVHTRIKNHSSDFWSQVAAHLPDYRLQKDWLKANGRLLTL